MYSQTIHEVEINGNAMQSNIVEASRLTLKTKFKIVSRVDIACTKLSQILPKFIRECVTNMI